MPRIKLISRVIPSFVILPVYLGCFSAAIYAQDTPVLAQSATRGSSAQSRYPPKAANRGRDEFVKNCSFCHGSNATGTSNGPNLILSTVVRHDDNGNQIGPVIRQGRPEKGMPPFNFTEPQIADVSAFLHSRITASDLRSANHTMDSYSLDSLLTGRPEAGKAFFFGAGRCSDCHSPTGDLAGIAHKYPPVTLQSRMLYPPNVERSATVVDSSGREWKGTLLLLTSFDVSIRDSAGWYRSWPLNTVKLHIEDRLTGHLELLSKYSDPDIHNLFAYLESLK